MTTSREIATRVNRLMAQGQFVDAIVLLEGFARQYPTDAHLHIVYNILGSCYLATKEFVKAQGAFQNAIREQPEFWDAHCNLGHAYLGDRKLSLALDKYDEVLRVAPGNPNALTGMRQIKSTIESFLMPHPRLQIPDTVLQPLRELSRRLAKYGMEPDTPIS